MTNTTKNLTIDGIAAANKEIAVSVCNTWKAGVNNKLELATFISEGYANCGSVDSTLAEFKKSNGTIDTNAYNKKVSDLKALFVKDLPFKKGTADKFDRIGRTKWLYEFKDIERLPNCYNTLEKLTTEAVTSKSYVLDYIKKNITSESRIIDINDMVTKVTTEKKKEEDEKSGSKASSTPKTEPAKVNGKDTGEANDNTKSKGKKSKDEGTKDEPATLDGYMGGSNSSESKGGSDDSKKSLKTVAFKVLIDTDKVTSDKETYVRFVGMLTKLATIVVENEDIASAETVESVRNEMVESLAKKLSEETEKELRNAA